MLSESRLVLKTAFARESSQGETVRVCGQVSFVNPYTEGESRDPDVLYVVHRKRLML